MLSSPSRAISSVGPKHFAVLAFILLRCVCVFAMLVIVGCERQVAPPLVEITELTPREIEAGDRLEVRGNGMPQGRTARVTFRGTLHRAGESPVRGASIDVDGAVVAPDRLEVILRDHVAERFCGRGDSAAHATFHGDVEVSFPSNNVEAPPLVGTLHETTLDVQPSSARAAVLEARVAEGRNVLSFLGIAVGPESPRGLSIEEVRPGSVAARSGLEVGDRLTSVDGVHVLSLGDVVPASARVAQLTIRHGDSGTEDTKTVSLLGYAGDRVPAEYVPALVLVGLAIAVFVVLLLPGPPSLSAIEVRIASQVRGLSPSTMIAGLWGTGRQAALSAIATAIIAAFALTRSVFGPEIDGVVLLASAGSFLVWSRVSEERGAFASLRVALPLMAAVLVMVVSLALTVVQVGAIELAEMVRVQGGVPWQFAAARQPACAILAGTYGSAVVVLLRVRAVVPGVEDSKPRSSQRAALIERAGVLSAAALGVAVFLGGWRVSAASEGRGVLLLSASVFAVKTWCVAALLMGAQRVASVLRPRDVVNVVVRRLFPALAAAAVVVFASRRLVSSAAIETAFGVTLATFAMLFVVRLATRVRAVLGRPEPHASPLL